MIADIDKDGSGTLTYVGTYNLLLIPHQLSGGAQKVYIVAKN